MVEQGSSHGDDGITMEAAHLDSTVRHWLSAVRLSADARLPPERDLAKKFRVSRAELRKVLAVLEAEGQIQRHVGKGTFVVPPPADFRPDGQDIAARTSPLAAMQARRSVEPELARLAALNATTAQFVEMRKLCSEMRRTPTWEAMYCWWKFNGYSMACDDSSSGGIWSNARRAHLRITTPLANTRKFSMRSNPATATEPCGLCCRILAEPNLSLSTLSLVTKSHAAA